MTDVIDEVIAEDAVKRYYVGNSPKTLGGIGLVEITPKYAEETGAKGLVKGEDYDALRQQLADVSNERDELRKQREAILMQARVWAGEAKTQRSTVESVGAILGGIPDWGPIAAGVEELKDRLNASEARNAELCKLLVKGGHLIEQMAQAIGNSDEYGDFESEIEAAEELAGEMINAGEQSAPATDEQGAGA